MKKGNDVIVGDSDVAGTKKEVWPTKKTTGFRGVILDDMLPIWC